MDAILFILSFFLLSKQSYGHGGKMTTTQLSRHYRFCWIYIRCVWLGSLERVGEISPQKFCCDKMDNYNSAHLFEIIMVKLCEPVYPSVTSQKFTLLNDFLRNFLIRYK